MMPLRISDCGLRIARREAAPESMSLHGFCVFVSALIMILTGLRFGG